MQVQLNTIPNVNFEAKFSNRAQAHLTKELEHLKKLSHDEMYGKYYAECTTFANKLINDIKGTNLADKPTLIDINKDGDKFEIKTYRTAVDMLKENYFYGQTKTVDKHIVNPLIDVLLVVKNALSSDKPAQTKDEEKYNKIKRLLDVRNGDFWYWGRHYCVGKDVRQQGISIKYKPWKLCINKGWNKNGEYYYKATWIKNLEE